MKFTIWLVHSLNLKFIIHTHITFFQLGDVIVLLIGKASGQRESVYVSSLCSICV